MNLTEEQIEFRVIDSGGAVYTGRWKYADSKAKCKWYDIEEAAVPFTQILFPNTTKIGIAKAQ